MNTVNQLTYFKDSGLPQPDWDDDYAKDNWLIDAADSLIHGADIKIQRRYRRAQGVQHAQFLTAVQMHLIDRQIAGEDNEDWFAQLVVDAATGAPCKRVALRLLGESQHTHGMLFEIAEKLLEPLAHDALIAQAEDNEL